VKDYAEAVCIAFRNKHFVEHLKMCYICTAYCASLDAASLKMLFMRGCFYSHEPVFEVAIMLLPPFRDLFASELLIMEAGSCHLHLHV
jgi:hypothetical protein